MSSEKENSSFKLISEKLSGVENWIKFKAEFFNACMSEGLLEYMNDGIGVDPPDDEQFRAIEAMEPSERKRDMKTTWERKQTRFENFEARKRRLIALLYHQCSDTVRTALDTDAEFEDAKARSNLRKAFTQVETVVTGQGSAAFNFIIQAFLAMKGESGNFATYQKTFEDTPLLAIIIVEILSWYMGTATGWSRSLISTSSLLTNSV